MRYCAMTHEKKVTVEVTKEYRDIEKSLVFHVGETHDVTEKRAEALVKAGVVKIADPEVAPVQPEQLEEEELGMVEPEEAEKKPSKTSRKVKTES